MLLAEKIYNALNEFNGECTYRELAKLVNSSQTAARSSVSEMVSKGAKVKIIKRSNLVFLVLNSSDNYYKAVNKVEPMSDTIDRVLTNASHRLSSSEIIAASGRDVTHTQISQIISYLTKAKGRGVLREWIKGKLYYKYGSVKTVGSQKSKPKNDIYQRVNLTELLFTGRVNEAVKLHKGILAAGV